MDLENPTIKGKNMIDASESVSDEPIAKKLYEKMTIINPGISKLELYEFQYALDGIKPKVIKLY